MSIALLPTYGAIAFLMMIVAALPLMLGYLILTPVLLCSVYLAFEDVYVPVAADGDSGQDPASNPP